MKARVGDRLIRDGGDGHRACEIIALHHADGSPPYVVRWLSDGHIALLYPGPYMRLAHQQAGPPGGGEEPASRAPVSSRDGRAPGGAAAGGARTSGTETSGTAEGGTAKSSAESSSAAKHRAAKHRAAQDRAAQDRAAQDRAAQDTGKGTAARPGAHRRANPFLPHPLAAPWPSQGGT